MDITTLILAKNKAKQYTDNAIAGLGKGIIYKGAVNYYNDLPNNAELGDCYSILYSGTSGSNPSGAEYVWGKINGSSNASWIFLGPDMNNYEENSNKVTSLSNSSTDTQYPSAKCVYDLIGDVESILTAITTGNGV